ncbi:MAG: MAPEG family protein [Pseudomonadota bacterium]
MTPTAVTLLSYVAWTLIMLAGVAGIRTFKVVAEGRAANSFSATGDDVAGLGQRITRAHANCFENLPAAAALLLYAIATGQENVTNGLAYALIALRIAQSIVHVISVSPLFVRLRFALFLGQVGILIYWLLGFFQSAA